MSNLRVQLEENGCSEEFIKDALPYEQLFTGDIDAFIEIVEDILISGEEYDPELLDDEDEDEDEIDPIYQSDYNYDGNDANIYFEEEEESFEDDEDEE